MMDGDHMEINAVVPLPEGWFYDTATKTKFRLDEDGDAIDEDGNIINVTWGE